MVLGSRALLALALVALLAACAARESAPDGSALKPNQGLLALKITSNVTANLAYNEFSSETSFGSRFAENMFGGKGSILVTQGEKYWVLPLEAGEYMWSKFSTGNQFANLHTSNRFTVRPNTITYIGDLTIQHDGKRVRFLARDRETEMRDHLRRTFPDYYSSMTFEKVLAELRL
jgi:hypothetical protein